jgi:NAD(P)-dependent dehydrogenase (short-subunit alcohol dehydrogenase family)
MRSVSDRPVAVVTGGARGIGQAISARLAQRGYTVYAASRTAPEEPLPDGVRHAVLDVTNSASVTSFFNALAEENGRVDVLVNNAGAAGSDRLDDPSDDVWRHILATNLDGAYTCVKAALPLMPAQTGRIINIASVLGLKGVPDQPAYVAAKHGLVGLTRALAHALGQNGITVNAICPGWVDTEMARGRFQTLGMTEEEAARSAPTGRITTPDEVAGMVAYLVSADAANVTGQALVIDGGWLA